MKQYRGYLIDLDGTVYAGTKKIPAAKRFIERLQQKQIPFLFVTNNSTQLPEAVATNLANNHDIYVNAQNVYTSGMATVDYLNQETKDWPAEDKTVLVVGEYGLKQVILQSGYTLAIDNPAFTVVGLDSDLTYEKLTQAVLAIRNGSRFVGTNPDTNIPKERGLLPGAGAVVDFVRYATQVEPVMIGKPQAQIINTALRRINLPATDVVMVGDNYNTDIKAGINAQVDTLLVYTGVSTPELVAKEAIQPTNFINSLDEWEV
ncbi:HAD-superfamily hydrolase [Lentilactobacillus senioris DSM 24302 = JCM 17472]|uniref:Acid sugar phosphatase n=1 Tax=Lentilactobacillus senioris DSM 24302 = JCM 17472 TaxID=1423802 RepID=A0A0R2CRX2_9LACO|nr:TIGR01457 family HAD-type hydrolase [Lentilactobacillus senioris]KRM93730.1 HAD-superfamily hydrolase [Lentilactobacillus senioris DSM 24302 = JCM 17472]